MSHLRDKNSFPYEKLYGNIYLQDQMLISMVNEKMICDNAMTLSLGGGGCCATDVHPQNTPLYITLHYINAVCLQMIIEPIRSSCDIDKTNALTTKTQTL
jgi:hypothetical protein